MCGQGLLATAVNSDSPSVCRRYRERTAASSSQCEEGLYDSTPLRRKSLELQIPQIGHVYVF